MPLPAYRSSPTQPLDALYVISLIEGTTLLILLGVAVPLKHLAGLPGAVSVMGPVHGVAFVAYLWATIAAVSGGDWRRRDIVRVLGAALVPFGAFLNASFVRRKQSSAAGAGDGTRP